MCGGNTNIVPPVVFCGKPFPIIDDVPRAIENPVGFRPCISHPSGCITKRTLSQELYAIGYSTPHAHLVLPIGGNAHERCAVLVFKQVVHCFIIAFHREIGYIFQRIEYACCVLAGFHRFNP
ncbi:hypothetical protein SDC9_100296 [bioreactor metagenome]|uniref:Uncharacterized protein n=1 Tax=bioreactor metagenome TaxID=1076179 RepID=A0A645ALB6_9ZZZZ